MNPESPTKEEFISQLSAVNEILGVTDSIVFFFEPVYENKCIVDFIFRFVSENFSHYQDKNRRIQPGDSLSKNFPESRTNGAFEIFVACMGKKGLEIDFDRPVVVNKITVWFHSNVGKRYDGLLVTSNDISDLKEKEHKLQTLNKQLQFQNTILIDAERISKTASFRWDIAKNSWLYSENVYNLLSTDKEELMTKINGIFDLLDSSQAQRIQETVLTYQYQDALPACDFTLINNEEVRHLSMIGNFVPVAGGQLLLGVIQDRTDIVRNQLLLEERNEALKQSNIELDSFNHIASHDLQEPLRKIRMFISRMEDLEEANFFSKGKQYLDKIERSSERMQKLIRHLLTYSRIGRITKGNQALDLNELLNEVIQENAIFIEESGGIITIDPLPTIKGVDYAINQLFTNLLSNALKYSKPNVTPELHVKADVLKSHKIKTSKFTPEFDKYVFIRFIDNGIGFDQDYSERIFELFQRLHQKNEFSGTGIGLAICRKIVQMHHGHIEAYGTPGKGSEFHLYFPIN